MVISNQSRIFYHDRVQKIFLSAQVSGLARSARGPVMSALPGKVALEGITEIGGRRYFVLSMLQGRDPGWCKRPFFAEYDPAATWLSDLQPAWGSNEFFYEAPLRTMAARAAETRLAEAA